MASAIAYAHFTMIRYSSTRLAHTNPHNNYILGRFAAGQSHPTIKLREIWPPKSSNDVTDNRLYHQHQPSLFHDPINANGHDTWRILVSIYIVSIYRTIRSVI